MQLAVDWIIGEAGEMDEQRENAEIVRVVIAGNSLSENTKDKAQMAKAKYLTKDTQASSIEAVKVLDNLLVQLAGSVDTDLMPGAFDPANQILPQQPLHPCLFPRMYPKRSYYCIPSQHIYNFSGVRVPNLQVSDESLHVLHRRPEPDRDVRPKRGGSVEQHYPGRRPRRHGVYAQGRDSPNS
jgi:DNA polymerase II small subunit/DNA polymerase delta subunit B